MQSSQIVHEATKFVKNWMTISSWESRYESWNQYMIQMVNKIEERQYKRSKKAAKVYTEGKIKICVKNGFLEKI